MGHLINLKTGFYKIYEEDKVLVGGHAEADPEMQKEIGR
jgi:hypothetical protein